MSSFHHRHRCWTQRVIIKNEGHTEHVLPRENFQGVKKLIRAFGDIWQINFV